MFSSSETWPLSQKSNLKTYISTQLFHNKEEGEKLALPNQTSLFSVRS